MIEHITGEEYVDGRGEQESETKPQYALGPDGMMYWYYIKPAGIGFQYITLRGTVENCDNYLELVKEKKIGIKDAIVMINRNEKLEAL